MLTVAGDFLRAVAVDTLLTVAVDCLLGIVDLEVDDTLLLIKDDLTLFASFGTDIEVVCKLKGTLPVTFSNVEVEEDNEESLTAISPEGLL